MLYLYDTKTGHSEKIAKQLSDKAIDVKHLLTLTKDEQTKLINGENLILVTHTEGKGLVPTSTSEFMKLHHEKVLGYVVTGNYIKHPHEFGYVGLLLHKEYNKPIIRLIQQEGDEQDIQFVKTFVENLDTNFNIK